MVQSSLQMLLFDGRAFLVHEWWFGGSVVLSLFRWRLLLLYLQVD